MALDESNEIPNEDFGQAVDSEAVMVVEEAQVLPDMAAGDDMMASDEAHSPVPTSPAALAQNNSSLYPFDFWPQPPWQRDPDTRDWPTREGILHDDHGARNGFLRTFGRFNAEAESGESRWIGVKFVGGGSFACAGLWVDIDPNRNILRVSGGMGLLDLRETNIVSAASHQGRKANAPKLARPYPMA